MKHLKVTSALLAAIMCVTMVMAPVAADETEAPSETQTVEVGDEKDAEESEENEPDVTEDRPLEADDQNEALDAVLAKGKCGKKVKWTLDKKGTLKITGKGAMKNYTTEKVGEDSYVSTAPWIKYASKIKKVVVSKKVTTIGAYAFCNCTNITSVSLPKKLKAINDEAFYNCAGLKSVSVPKKVKTIGISAFACCTSLAKINIPNGVKTISRAAFAKTAITGISIPKSVKTIEPYAFSECDKLKSITIPATVKELGHGVFYKCTSLVTVNIPIAGLSTMGERAFAGCTSLTSFKTPLTVTTLGSFAFDGCTSLEEAWISSKLDLASTGTFNGCPNLKGGNPYHYDYADQGESFKKDGFEYVVTFPEINGNGTVSVTAYSPNEEQIVFPNVVVYKDVSYKVTRIERNEAQGAYDNKVLKSVVIGSNVTSIANKAFGSCIVLESVTGGSKLTTIGREAFANCPMLKVFNISSKTLKKIGPYAFNGDDALKTLQIKKTTKLTKSGVKDSLCESGIKTVKVKKSKVKKYKKIFKKKNCGKKVKVKK
ncbi:MAG: leucine-rich repeat domain-containing protein [Clostridiales bacterium]|nr:leucine-rich repeat domain-containing protein [Clostridiales bacterium]